MRPQRLSTEKPSSPINVKTTLMMAASGGCARVRACVRACVCTGVQHIQSVGWGVATIASSRAEPTCGEQRA